MMSVTSSSQLSGAPVGLSSTWLAKTEAQEAEWTAEAPSVFTWQEPAGIDFETEIESVSRLFPVVDGGAGPPQQQQTSEDALLAAALSQEMLAFGQDEDALIEQQTMVCGGTLLTLQEEIASSPEQCLMSPSDMCLASPPSLMSPEPVQFKPATAAAVEEASSPALKLAPSVARSAHERARSSSAEEVAPSPSPTHIQTIIEHVTPQEAFAQAVSEALSFTEKSSAAVEATVGQDDEHTKMIDQALEDLKTLESMCGITSPAPEPMQAAPSLPVLKTSAPTSPSTSRSCLFSPAKRSLAVAPQKLSKVRKSSVSETVTSQTVHVSAAIKPEPVEEDDIQIVDEVAPPLPATPPKAARLRGPKVAVTPRRVEPTPPAPQPTQIVIVLTGEQLANIQKSGQLVLNASSLQAASSATSAEVKTAPSAPKKVAAVKGRVRPSGVGPMKKPRQARPAPTSTVTSSKQMSRKTSSKEPLSGWAPQKQQPSVDASEWAFPMVPPSALDPLPPEGPDAADAGIPDDLQDLFLDSPAVASLPSDDASTILDDLISGSVREHPQLFGSPPPEEEEEVLPHPPQQPLMQWAPSPGSEGELSPSPHQISLESWSPNLSPSPADPWSPPKHHADLDLTPGPDWSPREDAPPSRRRGNRPRPYDKQPDRGGVRKPPLSDEERRQRKKEQNKNAATRYRQKKKEEHDLVSSDQERLESRNKQLRSRVAGLTKELVYLRELMREVLRHRSAGNVTT